MTLEEMQPYEGHLARVRTKNPTYGGGAIFEGRVEIVDASTIRVVGQPRISGLSLGDASPYTLSIAHVVEVTLLN